MTHENAICTLECWAYARGYCVHFAHDGDDSVDEIAKIISINTTRSLETQLYTLLHECGHILIYGSDKVVNVKEVTDHYGEKSNIYRVFRVIEEVEAWKRGLSLADRLGIGIDKKKWNRDVARALKQYMKWCLDPNF
tara:strand:- start:159 stop:569 length:411 start_codon:yes stop_codon:yes gene_type:complete